MLGNISHAIYNKVEEYKKTATGRKKIMPMLERYFGDRYKDLTVEEFINLHNNKPLSEVYYHNVGSFSSIKPETIDEWAKELGVEAQSKIKLPAHELIDWEELEESLGKEETDKIREEQKGKWREVNKPLQVGVMTLERLYHSPSYSNKVSTSLFGTDVNPRRDQPLMNRGRYRVTGQKIKINSGLLYNKF